MLVTWFAPFSLLPTANCYCRLVTADWLLILRARRNVPVYGQVRQKHLDFGRTHGVRVPQAVEADETLRPHGIAVLGVGRKLADATGPAQAVEQAGRVGEGEFANIQAEHVVVEEGQGRVGLFQAGQGVLFGVRDMLEEAANIGGEEVAGVAFVVEEDEAVRPVGVAFPRPRLAETLEGDLSNEVEETGRLRRVRIVWGLSGHGDSLPEKGIFA